MSFKTLNIGATALMTSQLALNTVGHNVSNAATPGYTRQRVMTEAALPDIKTFGVLGSGVTVRSVTRVADEFLENQVREATTLFKYLEAQINSYENIEGIFNELTDNDLSSAFDDFWNGVSDVTNYVEDISTRRTLIFQLSINLSVLIELSRYCNDHGEPGVFKIQYCRFVGRNNGSTSCDQGLSRNGTLCHNGCWFSN